MTRQPVRLGLTGGIGSGKSTVAAFLAQAGAAVMDADAISRTLTQAGGLAIPAILAEFGETLITPDGAMNRDAMRALVFSNPPTKRQLEAIIHPLVAQALQAQTQAAMEAGKHCLVFDVPLLVESGERWRRQVDWVCVVDCQTETQIQRVMARNSLARPEIEAIMAQQASRAQRLAHADVVIYNDGLDLDQLQTAVHDMLARFGL
ncbi:MAG: dephospho-CoA kinase [Betaproteobacteria bacterium]|nr:dephospho-CoA kinase [Betaproteobacteria bacterium]NBZ99287.1 dephospho-CoA kinase [Betaproteobacteria bacterium]NDB43429.1 dephospho-CoA kinase [Betaproteobacteria bacterium]NDD24082.1 dephospho-CoA kinase [Betaproteobacteria bacterium]